MQLEPTKMASVKLVGGESDPGYKDFRGMAMCGQGFKVVTD